MPFQQTIMCASQQIAWEVDPAIAARLLRWAARMPHVLEQDLAGMGAYVPHWMLVGANAGRIVSCERGRIPGVPTCGALRCPNCRAEVDAEQLVWCGDIPALARPEACFQARSAALRAAGFAAVEAQGRQYLLVPLKVIYPAEWPHVEPAVCYSARWLTALGLPSASATHHLVGRGQACLFAWGQWHSMPVHGVLQQRVVNHLASLLKIVAGYAPDQAFIGRIHHEDWTPHA
jgi:hypothetical protein